MSSRQRQEHTYSPEFRAKVLKDFYGECEQCGRVGPRYELDYPVKVLRGLLGKGMHIDRIDPTLPYTLDNIRLLDKSCHARVGLRRNRDYFYSMTDLEDLDDIGEPPIPGPPV